MSPSRLVLCFVKKITIWLCLSVMCISSPMMVYAQTGLNPNKRLTQYIIDSWTTDKGLPNNGILDMVKTRDGYMWIGTYTSLVKFDGTSFEEFPQLVDVNGINSIHEDSNGALWIASNDGKLVRKRGDQFDFIEVQATLGNSVITSVKEDHSGTIWIATRSGLAMVREGALQTIQHPELSQASIYCLEVDALNNVWVGTSGQGLFKYSNGTIQRYTMTEGLVNNSVRAIHIDTNGSLWVGTEGGVTQFQYGKAKVSYTTADGLPHNYVNVILKDSRGSVWFGTDDGLVRLLEDRFEVLDNASGMTDNTIQTLLEDESGVLWIGTYYGGLNRLKDGKFVNYGILEGFRDEVINVSRSDGEVIWVGSNWGLSQVKNGMISSFVLGDDASINKVRDIFRDSRGALWLATSSGLLRFDGKIRQRVSIRDGLSSNRIRRIIEDRKGVLWIGTAKGLNAFDPRTGDVKMYTVQNGLTNEFILSIYQDSKDQIWVGTNGGGVFLLQGDRFKAFSTQQGLGSDIIFSLTEDQKGNLWASSNAGFSMLREGNFHNISRQNGLPTNNIFQLLTVKDDFWLFTGKGLLRIKSDDVYSVLADSGRYLGQVQLFNKSEGMRTDQVTGASISDVHGNGNLLVSTLHGLSILNPVHLNTGKSATKVIITAVMSDGLKMNYTDSIEFEAGTRNYEFHYAGLDFYAPEKVNFKYRLKNFDTKWIEVGNRRTAYYNYLPPGNYTFEVLASNSDGKWNKEPVRVTFKQVAYFYETYWFYGVVLFLLALIIYSANYARLRLLTIRNKKLGQLVKERTVDIEKQNKELEQLNHIKDKLFSLISHDLRGPVNSCSSLLELMNSKDISEQEFKSLSQVLTLQIGDVKDLLNDLLDWSKSQLDGLKAKPEKISLKAIVFENFKLFEVQASHKQLTLKNQLQSSEYVWSDVNMTKVIMRNLISNAIKFSNEGGVIEVLGTKRDGFFEFSVKDNGVGIKDEDQSKIFDKQIYTTIGTKNEKGTGLGLMLVKEFVQRNRGEVTVESELGKGSTFKFTLPVAE